MSDFQTILGVISESGGDRDAFIKAYQARLAKGSAQPAPTEPTPTRKGDTWTRALAGIIVEAERASDVQRRWDADRELERRLHARALAEAEAKKRTIAEKKDSYVNPYPHRVPINEPQRTGRGVEVRELRESVGGNLGRIVGRRE
jgi:hypothetical protein